MHDDSGERSVYVRPAAELVRTLPEEVFDQIAQAAAIMVPNGYALAATSFRKNGYAVKQAVEDLNALVAHYRSNYGEPSHILIAGASEGGLIATKLVEPYARPDGGSYDGGLALCGPMGGTHLPLILPVSRYGHCAFETDELLAAFGLLLLKTGAPITF